MVFVTQQVVRIILETIDKTTGKLVPIQRTVEKTTKRITGMTQEITTEMRVMDLLTKKYAGNNAARQQLFKTMLKEKMSLQDVINLVHINTGIAKKEIASWGKKEDILNKYVTTQKKTIRGMHGFRMEMLSVMFFGMNISRMFGQWNQLALDWLGISDYLQTTLGLVAFEGLLPFADNIYAAIGGLMNLDPVTKRTLGTFMLFGQATGMLLQTFGMLILGLSGLVQAFPGLRAVAAPAIGGIFALLTPLITQLLPSGIKEVEALKTAFGAISTGLVAGTVLEQTGTIKFASAKVSETVKSDTTAGFYAVFGKAFLGLAGGAMVLAGALQINHAKVTSNVYDDVIATAQTVFGASLIAGAAGIKGGRNAVFALSVGLLLNYVFGDPSDLLTQFMGILGSVGIVWSVTGKVWTLPIVPVIAGTIIGAGVLAGIRKAIVKAVTDFGKWYEEHAAPNITKSFETLNKTLPELKNITITRQYGGIVPGRLGEPVPIIAHGGERFLGIHGGGAGETIINFNPSYNINVSDKDELERMIRDSNERMMTELKRMVGG